MYSLLYMFVLFSVGELIGLEYLYSQSSGASIQKVSYDEAATAMENNPDDDAGEEQEDEGFEEPDMVTDLTIPAIEAAPDQLLPHKIKQEQPTQDTAEGFLLCILQSDISTKNLHICRNVM